MTGTALFRNTQEYQSHPASHTIFKEGDPAEEMYVVIQGQVDILIHGEIIDTIGPDGILGELALIDDHIRSATAVAKPECKLVPIQQKAICLSHLRDAVLRSGRHEGHGGSTSPKDGIGSFAGPGNNDKHYSILIFARSIPPRGGIRFSFIFSNAVTTVVATTRFRYHLRLAGTTYQGA